MPLPPGSASLPPVGDETSALCGLLDNRGQTPCPAHEPPPADEPPADEPPAAEPRASEPRASEQRISKRCTGERCTGNRLIGKTANNATLPRSDNPARHAGRVACAGGCQSR